jgi:hypothetical protein
MNSFLTVIPGAPQHIFSLSLGERVVAYRDRVRGNFVAAVSAPPVCVFDVVPLSLVRGWPAAAGRVMGPLPSPHFLLPISHFRSCPSVFVPLLPSDFAVSLLPTSYFLLPTSFFRPPVFHLVTSYI